MTYLDRAHYETMVYEELVNRLRTLAKYTWYSATVLEAADAIEELSAKYQKALSDLVKQAKPPKEE